MLESLYRIAEKESLPFEISNNKLHYTGPKSKVEKHVLDLYEFFQFDEPELANNLDGLDKIIPEYADYLQKVNKERRIQRKIGNIECDGHNFYATDKALEEITEQKDLYADTAAYFSFGSKEKKSTLEDDLESLGVSTKKPSKLKVALAATVMTLAAIGGAVITKDALAEDADDSPEKTGSRQSENITYEETLLVEYGGSPMFRRDGKMVVFSCPTFRDENITGSPWNICTINMDGSEFKKITNSENISESYGYPDWNPNGMKIAFSDSEQNLYIMNSDGTNINKLTDGVRPHWSPDGSKIVFSKERKDDCFDTYVINIDRTNLERLTFFNSITPSEAIWNPNGSKIAVNAFVSDDDGWNIYTMDPDGSDRTKISKKIYFNLNPTWNKNGTKIAFTSHGATETYDESDNGLYIVNDDGTNLQLITRQVDTNSNSHIDWFESKILFKEGNSIRYLDLDKPIIQDQEWQKGDYIVHITDTHVYKNNDGLTNFVNKVNNLDKKPKFVVVSGDLVDWGAGASGQENFEKFIEIMNRLDIDWYVVPGNHDARYGVGTTSIPIPLEGDAFGNYNELMPEEHDLVNKLKDYGDVVVFGLNSGWDELNSNTSPFPPEGSGINSEQLENLEEKLDLLDGIKDSKDSSGKKKVIFMHHPTSWKDKKARDDGVFMHNREEFKRICEQYNIDIVLVGHVHEDDIRNIDGAQQVVTDSAGANAVFRKITYTKDRLKVETQQIFEETTTGTVDCPAKITMYDGSGKKVNSEVQELPGAFYSGWEIGGDRTETVSAYGKDYYFVVEGTDNGTFQFSIKQDGKTTFSTDPLPITDKTELKFTPLEKKVRVEVDKDGDGKLEKKFDVSDGKLTKEEFEKGADSEEPLSPWCYIAGGALVVGAAAISIGGYIKNKLRKKEKVKPPKPEIEEEEEIRSLSEFDAEIEEEEETMNLSDLLEEE